MESEKLSTFNKHFQRMIDVMTDPEHFDRDVFIKTLKDICELFNLAKGVTEFYKSLTAEKDGDGEILCDYDNGKGEKIVAYRRYVTPSMTVIKSTIYMAEDAEPLSEEEYQKVDLTVRAILSFVSRNRLQSAVEQLAYYDEMGYPNINYFSRRIEYLNEKGMLTGNTAIQFNLRHFSLINREIGRPAGDIVMRNYFEFIKQTIDQNGIICRISGDNFAALFRSELLQRILFIMEGFPVIYDPEHEKRIMVSACVGVFGIDDSFEFERPGDIISRIFSAAQDAKLESTGTVVYYNEKSLADKEQIMRVRRLFSEGMENNEFQAYYQPKVDVDTGRIAGAEALCRWIRGGKTVPPSEFIPILEQNTDICLLDFYMLDRVCEDIRRWLDEKRPMVRVSVNLSRKHLLDIDLLDHLLKIIDAHRVPHKYIEFELTETTTDVEFKDLKRVVNGLQKEGIYTAVDDFGMGYSSLNLIREIPWDVLKIDRCLVPIDGEFGVTELLFRHVVSMGLAMGLECVVEGVETYQQVELLRENNCRIAQGYYFDRPMPASEFEKKLDHIYTV